MHSNNLIQNELKELNSMLAGISNVNVYTVPAGYFNVLSHDILLAVQENSSQITDKDSVPAGYFDGLADSIMNKIKNTATDENEHSALLADVKEINVYRVPPQYFNNLAQSITGKINAHVEDEYSELLNELKGINVYQVPTGYFENLSTGIVNKLPQQAKVVEMKKRSFFNYAAAAVITGIIGLSVISVFNQKNISAGTIPQSSSVAVMDEAKSIIQKNNFDEVLSTVSDADIVNYLQKGGQDVNAALVASVEEDKNLPDQVDYLTDDKTLDNLLSELNIDQSKTN